MSFTVGQKVLVEGKVLGFGKAACDDHAGHFSLECPACNSKNPGTMVEVRACTDYSSRIVTARVLADSDYIHPAPPPPVWLDWPDAPGKWWWWATAWNDLDPAMKPKLVNAEPAFGELGVREEGVASGFIRCGGHRFTPANITPPVPPKEGT